MKTYIIGHKKPDTDAVISALALQYLYRKADFPHGKNPEAVITEKLNPETAFLFDKFEVDGIRVLKASDINPDDQVVLVDHNEESQRLDGLNQDQIVKIIDHHKASLNLNTPISMTFKTWGSTSTIIYDMMKHHQVVPDKSLAGLMLAAVLSDTVGYKSATTTGMDKQVGEELAKIAEINDVEAFTLEIFKAKSNAAKLSDEEIVKNDYKIFNFSQKTLINQIETVEPEVILERKDSLLKAMKKLKDEEGVDLVFCAISDILKVNTKLLLLSEAESKFAQEAFNGSPADNLLDIGAKLSRKKEIAPPLEIAIK